MTNSLDRLELAERLLQHTSAGDSGTLLIRSSDGHSLMIAFEKGVLISLLYGKHRGPDAMPDILMFSSGTYTFTEGLVGRPQNGLPSAKELAGMLRETRGVADTTASQGRGESLANFELDIEQLAELLMEYVGPIATMLCESVRDEIGEISSQGAVNSFIKQLSLEIDDEDERKQFASRAAATLSLLK
ncbi:MAG: DUF4388 domain-containing protein [Gammaproteobacteria bacterium]|nr:DUF4388 domain-containing protein [Gammaproteobacteria bacterium]